MLLTEDTGTCTHLTAPVITDWLFFFFHVHILCSPPAAPAPVTLMYEDSSTEEERGGGGSYNLEIFTLDSRITWPKKVLCNSKTCIFLVQNIENFEFSLTVWPWIEYLCNKLSVDRDGLGHCVGSGLGVKLAQWQCR